MSHQQGQVAANAALNYHQFFVPALFAPWPKHLLDSSSDIHSPRILDVACGTGVVASRAAKHIPNSQVTGLDINPGMLEVAKTNFPELNWVEGDVAKMPFGDDCFDHTYCQFGLMFFPDPSQAAREMIRVTRPGGDVLLAVWGPLPLCPAYQEWAALLESEFGEEIAVSKRAPFAMGNFNLLRDILAQAGASDFTMWSAKEMACHASIDQWIWTEVKAWTLADVIDDDGLRRLQNEANRRFAHYTHEDGSVHLPMTAYLTRIKVH